jgi:DNA-binding response OmpR family regulator
MTSIHLIDFPERLADPLEASLVAAGWRVNRMTYPAAIDPNPAAIFVCGESGAWLQTLRQIRNSHPGSLLVVATRLADQVKWLDALEAGADDYCCLPLAQREIVWLIRPKNR